MYAFRYLDCRTGKDEQNCPGESLACRLDQFRCASGDKCVDTSAKCDHRDDCGDNSDEANCSQYFLLRCFTMTKLFYTEYSNSRYLGS